jgi:ParD-like antitoxin of type II bacterial toxin-antitoxin system
MSTMPIRVDKGLFDAARAAGALYSRSAAQQLGHWARLGRAMEASPSVTQDAIARVLAGQEPYDDLPDPAQAVVRVEWEDRVAAILGELDFTDGLRAAGQPWAEADEDGNLVTRDAAAPGV